MARQVGFNNVFSAGELAPDLRARSDLQQHAHGCALAQNFVGLVGGSLARRAGFWDAGATREQDGKSWLVPFRRSRGLALMLEFSDGYLRVWKSDYTPVLSGGVPYEIASPFSEAELSGLRPKQSNDVLYLFHADSLLQPQALTRLADDQWAFTPLTFVDGPFLTENDPANGRTMTLTGAQELDQNVGSGVGSILAGAVVAVSASAAVFTADHVGALFRLRASDSGSGAKSWVSGYRPPTVGHYAASNGRVYVNQTVGLTDNLVTTPPVHSSGDQSDGAQVWRYRHDGAGVVQITSVSSATSATGVVLRTAPLKSGQATRYFAEGAYSNARGWPSAAPEIHEERMVTAATDDRPDVICASRTAGYYPATIDMKPGLGTGLVVDDDAVRVSSGGDGRRVVWLASAIALIAGTTEGEVMVTSGTGEDRLAPSSGPPRTVTDHGSADVLPVKAHGAILFVARSGEELRSISLSPDQSLSSQDMSVVATHICERGIAQIAWSAKPDNICWARLNDGGLAAFTYHAEMEVKGWTSLTVGDGSWTVESIATLPAYGSRDALWAVVSRSKGGQTQRRIFVSSLRRERMRLDGARLYSGEAAEGVGGLGMWNGETVTLMAGDGTGRFAHYRDVLVTDGEAYIPDGRTATYIVAGQPFSSRFESLPLDLGGPGSGQTRKQKIERVDVVLTGVEFMSGVLGDDDEVRLHRTQVERRVGELDLLAPKRSIESATLESATSRDPRLVLETDSGFDLEIHALRPGGAIHD